jgi:hypothetical protein
MGATLRSLSRPWAAAARKPHATGRAMGSGFWFSGPAKRRLPISGYYRPSPVRLRARSSRPRPARRAASFPGRQMGCLYLRRKWTRADLCPGFPGRTKMANLEKRRRAAQVEGRWKGVVLPQRRPKCDGRPTPFGRGGGSGYSQSFVPGAEKQLRRCNIGHQLRGDSRRSAIHIVLTAPLGQSPEALTAVLNWTSLLRR